MKHTAHYYSSLIAL